jgi:hypothetical protein
METVLFDLPDVEIDKAHREHVVCKEGKLVLLVLIVGLASVLKKFNVFLLALGLEGER